MEIYYKTVVKVKIIFKINMETCSGFRETDSNFPCSPVMLNSDLIGSRGGGGGCPSTVRQVVLMRDRKSKR